jgi:hypothetical protein
MTEPTKVFTLPTDEQERQKALNAAREHFVTCGEVRLYREGPPASLLGIAAKESADRGAAFDGVLERAGIARG